MPRGERGAAEGYQALASSRGAAFADLLGIYAESIPRRERKTDKEMAALVRRSDYRVLLAERDGRTVGFSVLFLPAGQPFGLLEYMAVHPAHRSLGLGGRLLAETFAPDRAGPGRSCGLLEVDSLCGEPADPEVRAARQRFYRRHGCLAVDGLSYVLPLPGSGDPPRMDLMAYFPRGRIPLSKTGLTGWLRIVYRDAYGCAPDDPRIDLMMGPVADPVLFA
jgi:GNAT superfamily N-acetyltransferase